MKKQVLTALVTAVSLFGIYWINAGQSGLKPTGEVGWQREAVNYTQPPGWVFSIWGLIYLGFVGYAVYGLIGRRRHEPLIGLTTGLAAWSLVLNLAWVAIAGAEWFLAAHLLQWGLLILAVILLYRFQRTPGDEKLRRLLSIPFALYAGWLTVAMIPFSASLLNQTGWRGGPLAPPVWGCVLFVVAAILVVWAYSRLRQPFYLLPLAWALLGLSIRFDGAVRWVAGGLAAVLLLFFLFQLPHWGKERPRRSLSVPG